jgi:hypothetical protein
MESNETETNLVEEIVNNTEESSVENEDSVTFDANAFSDISNDSDDSSENSDNNTEDNDSFELNWDDNESSENSESNEEQNESSESEEAESEEANLENTSTEINYELIGDKIGAEIKSEEDLKKYVDEKNKQIEELQELTKGNVTNEKIKNLKTYISLEDKELLRADFKAQGFSDEEIDEAVDVYTDNGTIGIEAKKIRNTLNRSIDLERNKMIEKQKAKAKLEEQEVNELRNNIKEFIFNSETMFGFKMAKDEDSLKTVREKHYEYTTGKFYKEITESEQTMSEAAWLWKNRDVIINAAKNRGTQKGRKDILDEITVPDDSRSTRIREESTGEFNVNKFVS